MSHQIETIVALSSGSLPSGLAVVRMSGPHCKDVLVSCVGVLPIPRKAVVSKFLDHSNETIDEGLLLWFPAPASYTGEDCAEFHIHGGRAVVSAMLDYLCSFESIRLADAGEFSRRAFENGKKDLTAIDGIADLIASETDAQRRLAVSQTQGSLRELYDGWREQVIYIRAMLEAEFDFSDEEDVPEEISEEGLSALSALVEKMQSHLDDNRAGEIIRDGFRIALMGKPNAGKSSLLNALAKRDVAIVTQHAGTTRDVLEVQLDLDGKKVIVLDTAGLREASDDVEREGIKRAMSAGDESDLVVWLSAGIEDDNIGYVGDTESVLLRSKIDLHTHEGFGISSITGDGMSNFISFIIDKIDSLVGSVEVGLITRKRYREGLLRALEHLKRTRDHSGSGLELRAEEARLAGIELGRLTGKVDVEDLLDVIFSKFCVGK